MNTPIFIAFVIFAPFVLTYIVFAFAVQCCKRGW